MTTILSVLFVGVALLIMFCASHEGEPLRQKIAKNTMVSGVLLAIALSSFGCASPATTPSEPRDYFREDLENRTRYARDHRTGGCLLASRTSYNYFSYAPVECTPEVEKLIVKNPG